MLLPHGYMFDRQACCGDIVLEKARGMALQAAPAFGAFGEGI